MSTQSSIEAAQDLTALATAATSAQELNRSWHLVLPEGYTHKDVTKLVEAAQDAPSRKSGTITVKDVPSLLAVLADQKAPDVAYVYADPDKLSITAVFNDNRLVDFAGWRDHRAVFQAEFTPEFARWLARDKQAFAQTEFAEWIEDNAADLADQAQVLLDVATTIQATSAINFSSAKRLQNGQTQLTYNEVIDARAGAAGSLEIPKTFALGLRIFKNGEGYKLTCRLKYRMNAGSVKFWYELDRADRAIEDAFNGYVEKVRTDSGYVVLLGAA